jgi:hypothetical protein
VATPALVQTFPYVAWILLAALAFGSFGFVAATRQWTDATTGYGRFTALCAALLALLAYGVDGGLTIPDALAIRESPRELAAARTLALLGFTAVAVAYAVLIRRTRASQVLAGAGIALALTTLAAAAFGWVMTPPDGVPLLVQLAMLCTVTGGSLAAIVLGHWYLVTPRISERPLILQARWLLLAVLVQLLLFVTWTTLGGGPGQGAFEALTGANALLVIMRGLVTILFPAVLCYMGWRTAQTRSMESATGLLYINLAAVMAGTIGAAALYVSSGILV